MLAIVEALQKVDQRPPIGRTTVLDPQRILDDEKRGVGHVSVLTRCMHKVKLDCAQEARSPPQCEIC